MTDNAPDFHFKNLLVFCELAAFLKSSLIKFTCHDAFCPLSTFFLNRYIQVGRANKTTALF